MKKITIILVTILMSFCIVLFAACPGETNMPEEPQDNKITTLVGHWRTLPTRGQSDPWYEIFITSDTIEMYYNDTYSHELKWFGTYADPNEPFETLRLESVSKDDENWTRIFEYSDGLLITERDPSNLENTVGGMDTFKFERIVEESN